MDDVGEIIRDSGLGPVMNKLVELKLIAELMKAGKGLSSTQTYDASKIWNEINGFEPDTPFTVFVMVFKDHNESFDHMTVIPDRDLDSIMTNPIFAPYVKDVMSFFIRYSNIVQRL